LRCSDGRPTCRSWFATSTRYRLYLDAIEHVGPGGAPSLLAVVMRDPDSSMRESAALSLIDAVADSTDDEGFEAFAQETADVLAGSDSPAARGPRPSTGAE
jgi:hypothetical protein